MTALSVSFEQAPAGVLPVHGHDAPHSCFVLGGGMIDRQWRGDFAPATPGTLLMNPPGTDHEIEADTDGLACIVIEWDKSVAIERLRSRSTLPAYHILKDVLQDLNSPNPACKAVAENRIAAVVKRMMDYADEAAPSWLVEARAVIEELSEETSIAHISKWAGVHRSTFTKHFQAHFGMTPEQYRMMVKLGRAAHFLMSGASLAASASEAGFADQPHLTRVWRRYFGAPPRQWMRANATIVQ